MPRTLVVCLLLAALVACSDDSQDNDSGINNNDANNNNTRTDGGTPGKDGSTTGQTIYKITDGTIKEGTEVTLPNVVVTAVDGFGNFTGDVFVQETAGGKGSGIKLFGAKRSDGKAVSTLKPGDRVKVTGTVKYWYPSSGQFSDSSYPNKKHVKELEKVLITYIASGTAPTPDVVTAKQVTDASTADGWEHVLVQIKDLTVTQIKAPAASYNTVDAPSRDATGFVEIRDDLSATTSLKKLGCYSVTGVMSYFYGYRLQPRSAADIATGDTTKCPAPKSVKISDIQDTSSASHPADKAWVKVTGVISAVDTTASTSSGKTSYTGFWLQDEAGGKYSGIYVYWTWYSTSTVKPVEGDRVELLATYTEYNGISELTYPDWDKKASAVTLTPTVVAAKDLTQATTGEPYEGVLVQIKDVTSASAGTHGFKDKTSGLEFVNSIYAFTNPTDGTAYSSITGVVHVYKNQFQVFPRKAADLVKKP